MGPAMENHLREESGNCESILDSMGENFIMKGPQLTEQQVWLHEVLSIADLIATLCLLTQTRSYPAWEFSLCGNQITTYLCFLSTTFKSDLWGKPRVSLS